MPRFFLSPFSKLLIALVTTLLTGSVSYGLELDPKKIRVKPLENNIAVVQNRYFDKAFRPELGLFYGRIMNEAYTETNYTGYRLSMFFTESFGLELSSLTTSIKDSPDRVALNSLEFRDISTNELVTPDPEVNTVKGANEVSLFFAPLYGKINFFDAFIIYSDLYFTGGYSMLDTDQEEIGAVTYGVGQRLYFTKYISLRWDLKLKNYTEERQGTSSSKTSYNMDFGLCVFVL